MTVYFNRDPSDKERLVTLFTKNTTGPARQPNDPKDITVKNDATIKVIATGWKARLLDFFDHVKSEHTYTKINIVDDTGKSLVVIVNSTDYATARLAALNDKKLPIYIRADTSMKLNKTTSSFFSNLLNRNKPTPGTKL